MGATLVRHIIALTAAAVLVFVVRVQDMNLQGRTMAAFDQRWFIDYTPYFPGLANIETHEVFSPRYEHVHKIVFLGASSVDSIGCDHTWHPEPGVEPNVHYSCSIAGQMNELFRREGVRDWRAFDLARAGAKMTDTLYVYSRIHALHPDIVVIGDSFNYYMWENADANALSSPQYAYLDRQFAQTPQTASIWASYRDNLAQHGWQPPVAGAIPPRDPIVGPQPRNSTSPMDLLVRGIALLRAWPNAGSPPRRVEFDATYNWNKAPYYPHAFENPDPDFRYFQGVTLIADEQRQFGGHTMFFFAPQWEYVDDPATIQGLQIEYGGYLAQNRVPFVSYVPMRMQLVRETYDGSHQTMYGNRRLAQVILHDLRANGLLPGGG